jgi:hypothetical protein
MALAGFAVLTARDIRALTTPSLTASVSSPRLVGGTMTDTAVISGATSPTGSITLTLLGNGCETATLLTSVKPVSGNGSYTSDSFGPLSPGTYFWAVSYSGDANNSAVAIECGYQDQQVVAPEYCSSPLPCGTVTSGCPGALVVGNQTFVNSTTACSGESASTTTTIRTYIGPNDVCADPDQSIPCHIGAGDVGIATNVETVTANVAVVPTLSIWGLGGLVLFLGTLALQWLARNPPGTATRSSTPSPLPGAKGPRDR